MTRDATTIYQNWLDITSSAVLSNDLDTVAHYTALPYRHESPQSSTLIETREDLDHGHTSFAASLRALGVNHFIQLATQAEFMNDDYIEGHHVTHILSNARRAVPTFTDRIVLRRVKDVWKMVEHSTALDHGTWPVNFLRPGVLSEAFRADHPEDTRRGATDPIALYQSFLNKIDQSNTTEDIDVFCALFSYPCTFHTMYTDQIIETLEDMKPLFGGICETLRQNGVGLLKRTGTHAEFISASELCGYHTSRFLVDDADVLEPIKTRLILKRTGTEWRARSVTNCVRNEKLPYTPPVPSDVLVTQREIQERTKTWPISH